MGMENNSEGNSIGISKRKIKENLRIALGVLFRNETFLLEHGVHENAVSYKLATYLESLFPEWNVDFQYNKKELGSTKDLPGIGERIPNRPTENIIPDILIHHRGRLKDNLLVIEIKVNDFGEEEAKIKLEEFTRVGSQFEYPLGVFIRFYGLADPSVIWYENGTKLNE